jgi:hypothetical protein
LFKLLAYPRSPEQRAIVQIHFANGELVAADDARKRLQTQKKTNQTTAKDHASASGFARKCRCEASKLMVTGGDRLRKPGDSNTSTAF